MAHAKSVIITYPYIKKYGDFMKYTLKFLMALGSSKLVIVESGDKSSRDVYTSSSEGENALRRISDAVTKQTVVKK